MDEEINYKTLRKIQEIEKNSPVLANIKPDFYKIFLSYLKNLNNRLDQEKTAQKQILIRDEIENTKKIATSIYEYREKKILLAAISKARGGSPDLKNIIQDEKALFDSVYELILQLRKSALDVENLKGEEIKTDESRENPPNENQADRKKESETKINELKEITSAENKIGTKNQNPIVLITQDIPEFIGTDGKKYNLRKNDIISLQDNMSNMLIKKGVAQEINM